MPLASGTSLGPYQIESPLGAGGMGEVYRAKDTRLDRTVAINVLREHVECKAAHSQVSGNRVVILASVGCSG